MTTMMPHTVAQEQMHAVLNVLQPEGRHTLEQLSHLAGMPWWQVFVAIDELSRRGTVRLRRVGSEYEVSLGEGS
jgi:DNA-binding IclR family transcriptional regulator